MTHTVVIARHPDTDMAYVLVDDQVVFMGNEWDFHSGCRGTMIAGCDLAGKWDRGVESLATVLAGELATAEAVRTRELSDEENDMLCYGLPVSEPQPETADDVMPQPAVAEPVEPLDDAIILTDKQIAAIGERACELCGEDVAPELWCVACSEDHDETHCPTCCTHGARTQRRSLRSWLADHGL
jgi:hypothetical protein